MKKIFTFVLLGLAAFNASAEKADAAKRAYIDYDEIHTDLVSNVHTLTGNVIVTKGTLGVRAEKAVYKAQSEGGVQILLYAAPGKLATFRQKRDGAPNLWVEGEAKRIEYDERTAVMKLFGSAKVRQLEGTVATSEFQNEFISYDSLREVVTGRNDAAGGSKVGGTRGRVILEPSAPAPVKPAGTP